MRSTLKRLKKGRHLIIQVRNRKVLGWEEIYKPEVCEEMVGWEDELHMHYEATRSLFFRIPFYFSCLSSFVQGGRLKIWIIGGQLPRLWALLSLGLCDINSLYITLAISGRWNLCAST